MSEQDFIEITEEELVRLIRATEGTRNHVPLSWGIRRAALKWKEAKWALPLLAEWRGVGKAGTP